MALERAPVVPSYEKQVTELQVYYNPLLDKNDKNLQPKYAHLLTFA